MGSSRYCRFIRRSDGRALTEEDSRRVPSYELFQLYLDMMVDRVHPRQAEVLGPRAMDEPILARVFDEGMMDRVRVGDADVPVPRPHLLLAMKLRSLPDRQREDKAIKDACDAYALLWHSPGGIGSVLDAVRREYPGECRTGLAAITDEVAGRAAAHLGVAVGTFMDVVGRQG